MKKICIGFLFTVYCMEVVLSLTMAIAAPMLFAFESIRWGAALLIYFNAAGAIVTMKMFLKMFRENGIEF